MLVLSVLDDTPVLKDGYVLGTHSESAVVYAGRQPVVSRPKLTTAGHPWTLYRNLPGPGSGTGTGTET